MSIPLQLCISDSAKHSPIEIRHVLESISPEAAKELGLCYRLWWEKSISEDPFFKKWVAILEESMDLKDFAHHWNSEQMARCGPFSAVPYVVNTVLAELAKFKDDFRDLHSKFPEVLGASVPGDEDLEWLHFISRSRAFTLEQDDTTVHCLCPMAEFANHAPNDSEVKYASLKGDEVVIRACTPLKAGDQVTFDYQKGPNDELVCNFGFAVPDNPNQQVPLKLGVGTLKPMHQKILKALNLLHFLREVDGNQVLTVMLRRTDPFPNVAVVILRIIYNNGQYEVNDYLKPTSPLTKTMDVVWLPRIKGHLKQHFDESYLQPLKSEENSDNADFIYSGCRDVLAKALARLDFLSQSLSSKNAVIHQS